MNTYERIREKLNDIPIVDDHSHVLTYRVGALAWDGPYEVMPLSRLLMDFNIRSCFTLCGLSDTQVDEILLGHISPEEQKKLLTGPHAKNKTTFRFLISSLRELYSLDIWDITEENWDAVNAALAGNRNDYYGLLETVFTKANVKSSVLNMWSRKCLPYLTDYKKDLTQREKELDSQFFLFSNTIDAHAVAPFGPIAQGWADVFGLPLDTLAEYEAMIEKLCVWSVHEMDVRAFKNTEMYYRRLDYRVRSFEEAAPCYKPDRTAEESRILEDYIACIVFRMAGKLGVPVQIHTGSIWGDFAMDNISPEHLATVITAFPNTKFDLLHGGDPFYGTMALMGAGFKNVYVNMSTMANTCYTDFQHWLSVFLDRVPTSKITIGWDEFAPELIVGNAWHTRNAIAQVLAQKVDAGLYSEDMALEIAKDIMFRTADSLYGI